ncbi:hypothetical protein KVV02_006564 [Mortierella alpina]|uniref:Zinc metalloprotease n=1 Tax=Mortierella alpina TaxID=64518 RepID=A0A9P8A4S9_MORAP|nr:hypothetical protein KVV02_006564 [Mortierella alpina]
MVLVYKHSLLVLLSIITFSAAHSPAWPTIAYSEVIHTVRHDVLPRKQRDGLGAPSLAKRSAGPSIVQQDDRVKLELSAFNRTFFLHLQPNYDLIHPQLDLSGHEDLHSKDDITAFKGVVVQDEDHSRRKWDRAMSSMAVEGTDTVEHMLQEEGVLGWARMMIEHADDESLILRGAFTAHGDTYHVNTRQHYHCQKRSEDHVPSSSPGQLVIYRDSDLHKRPSIPRKQYNAPQHESDIACAAHTLLNRTESDTSLAHSYYYPSDVATSVPRDTFPGSMLGVSSLLGKRQDTVALAAAGAYPPGCPTSRLVNYIGVAADCTYVRNYGGLANARKQIFADFNTASGIYESTFNVALGIVSLQIESMNCPQDPVPGKLWNQACSANYTISNRLSDFSFWRGQGSRSKDGVGLWHLMTKCNSGSILGLAWTGALCQAATEMQGQGVDREYTAGTGVSSVTPNEWLVVAHELGHGFGANHDCTATSCVSAQGVKDAACCPFSTSTCDAADKYIMNPAEQAVTTMFSPCSISAICTTIGSKDGQCLKAPQVRTTQLATTNVCGNGIREEGEQCDCGTPEECAKDPCCDGTTCKLKGAAVCDDKNDDCCHHCQFASQGTVCRSAISICDIPETCSGISAACPADEYIPNLTACDITGAGNQTLGKGQCARGICTSRDQQCAQMLRPGVTKHCDALASSCDLICNDPNGVSDSCLKIPGSYFVDGSPCGSSDRGTCSSGRCINDGGWAANHLSILIPVICAAVFMLGGAVWAFCLYRRKKRRQASVSATATFSMVEAKNRSGDKDPMSADVPKWMMTGDRRSALGVSRKMSQAAASRNDSFAPHNGTTGLEEFTHGLQQPQVQRESHAFQGQHASVADVQRAPYQ